MITLPPILMPTIFFGADLGCWKLDDNIYSCVVRRHKEFSKNLFTKKDQNLTLKTRGHEFLEKKSNFFHENFAKFFSQTFLNIVANEILILYGKVVIVHSRYIQKIDYRWWDSNPRPRR